MKYVQMTVVLTVKATDEEAVRTELAECLDLIEAEHLIFDDDVSSEFVDTPADAMVDEDD